MSDYIKVEDITNYVESKLLREIENRKKLNEAILNDALQGLDSHPDTILDVLTVVLSYSDSHVRSRTFQEVREYVKDSTKLRD